MSADYITSFTRSIVIHPETTALIVVDMQYATGSRNHGLGKMLTDQGRIEEAEYRFDRIENFVIPNSAKLLTLFRSLGSHVIYLTYGSELPDCSDAPSHIRGLIKATNNIVGQPEHKIVEALAPKAHELVFNKVTMGGFGSTGIESRLRALDITELVMVGVSTNNCVGMSAMEASDRGFGVVIASDATGTCDAEAQEAFELMFLRLWGRVMTTDDVITEMEANGARQAAQ